MEAEQLAVAVGATTLAAERSGPTDSSAGHGDSPRTGGQPVVLLHGLTATRRYVVMGSGALQRAGHLVLAYDARGHGRSTPAGDGGYGYGALAGDLGATMDAAGLESAVLAGASMGAQTAVRYSLAHPQRVAGLVLITPAFDPRAGERDLAGWDALARGLREGGTEGFVAAYDFDRVAPALRPTIETVLRQRLAAHSHPLAVADALEEVPRSRPFERISDLARIAVPTLVVASRDRADPSHPLAVGEAWAAAIPGARLAVEEDATSPRSPIAWQGGRLSKLIAGVAAEAGPPRRSS
jgi:pimeloyl-ACP methyl ester carboxylesterase